jgi:hypothetical protein
MKAAILLVTLLAVGCSTQRYSTLAIDAAVQTQAHVATLISDLVSDDWPKVWRAKLELESRETEGIGALIDLLDRDDVVPLRNTADLIYPGAKEFYGHGFIVDYDLDRVAVRAGWVMEETAFEDFGFSEGAIHEADLLQAAIDGKRDVPLQDVVPTSRDAAARTQRLSEARVRAKTWWAAVGNNWSRYIALRDALTSVDADRQMNALDWLRHGETTCRGLSPETYSRDLLPHVKRLASSGSEGVRQQARLLTEDHEGWWWRHKTGKLSP